MNQPEKKVAKTVEKKQAKTALPDLIRGKFDGFFVSSATILFVLSFFFAGATFGFIAGKSVYFKILIAVVGVLLSVACLYLTSHWPYLIGLVKGARIELYKVHTPSKDEWSKSTLMVLVLVSVFAIMLSIIDWFLALFIKWVL